MNLKLFSMSVASEGLNLSKEVTAGTVGTLSDPVRAGLALGPGANLGQKILLFQFLNKQCNYHYHESGKGGKVSEYL